MKGNISTGIHVTQAFNDSVDPCEQCENRKRCYDDRLACSSFAYYTQRKEHCKRVRDEYRPLDRIPTKKQYNRLYGV